MKRLTNEKMAIILAVSVIISVTACSAEGVAYVDGNRSEPGFSSSAAATSSTIYEESTLPASVSVTTAVTTTKAKETTAVLTTVASTPAIPPRPQPSTEAVLTSTYARFIKSCRNRIKQFLHSRNSEVTLKLNCPTAKVSSKQKGVPSFQRR